MFSNTVQLFEFLWYDTPDGHNLPEVCVEQQGVWIIKVNEWFYRILNLFKYTSIPSLLERLLRDANSPIPRLLSLNIYHLSQNLYP